MATLKKLFVLMLLVGFSTTTYAAVSDVELISCSVYSEADGEKGEEEDEEPDCE